MTGWCRAVTIVAIVADAAAVAVDADVVAATVSSVAVPAAAALPRVADPGSDSRAVVGLAPTDARLGAASTGRMGVNGDVSTAERYAVSGRLAGASAVAPCGVLDSDTRRGSGWMGVLGGSGPGVSPPPHCVGRDAVRADVGLSSLVAASGTVSSRTFGLWKVQVPRGRTTYSQRCRATGDKKCRGGCKTR